MKNSSAMPTPTGRDHICVPRMVVLVVSADADSDWYAAVDLVGRRFDVQCAVGGEEALQAAADEPPDLVVIDYSIPGISGSTLGQALRKQPRGERAPLLLMAIKPRGAIAEIRPSELSSIDLSLCGDDPGIGGMVVGVLNRFGEFLAALRGTGGAFDSHCHPAMAVPAYRQAPQAYG